MFSLSRKVQDFFVRLLSPYPPIFLASRIVEINNSLYLLINWISLKPISDGEFLVVLEEVSSLNSIYQFSSFETEQEGEIFYQIDEEIPGGRTYRLELRDTNGIRLIGTDSLKVEVPGGLQIGSSITDRHPAFD